MNAKRKGNIAAFIRDILRIPLGAYSLSDDKHQRADHLRRARRELLLLLATYGNAHGASIRPGIQSLMSGLGWSRSHVHRTTRDLQTLRFLKDDGLHEETGCRMWSISPNVCHEFRTQDTVGVSRVALPSVTSSSFSVTSSGLMVPDLEVDPKIDHTAVSLDGNKDPLVEVWNYFHQETDQPTFYTFTSTRRRQAEKRFTEALKKVKDGDPARAVFLMKCAIDAIRDSKWHNGKNPEKQNYVSWESVFGTAEKFEEWLRRS